MISLEWIWKSPAYLEMKQKGTPLKSNQFVVLTMYVARYDGLLSYHLLNWQITEQLWCSWVYNMVYQWKKFFSARPEKFHGCRTTFHACPDIYGSHPVVSLQLINDPYITIDPKIKIAQN